MSDKECANNMSSWKIFLTKSPEVARLIASTSKEQYRKKDVFGVSCGPVDHDCRIPEIYHDKGYHFCAVEYKNGEDWGNPAYELVIA